MFRPYSRAFFTSSGGRVMLTVAFFPLIFIMPTLTRANVGESGIYALFHRKSRRLFGKTLVLEYKDPVVTEHISNRNFLKAC
jgi:hypothetical protein